MKLKDTGLLPKKKDKCPHQEVNPNQLCYRCKDHNDLIDECGEIEVLERLDEKKIDFENFLMEIHAEDYIGTDDMMPNAFADWVGELGSDDVIDYTNKFIKYICHKLGTSKEG